jgi:endogenous inhibitor of DNA gyrase (YacG/DUF329 family)
LSENEAILVQNQIQKICPICGNPFYVIPYRTDKAKYCSRKCYYKSQIKLIRLRCAICKKIFFLPPNRLHEKNFCSVKCRTIASRTRPQKICPVCHKTFKARWSGRSRQIYCSRKCMAIAYTHKLSLTCEICGKQFTVPLSLNRRRFCSLKCSQIHWRAEIKEQYKSGRRKESLVRNQFCAYKRVDLNNQFFRSSWEANIARFLNFLGIKWIYEPERFLVENGTYLPDFFLVDLQCYFEVKGWSSKNWREKIDLFSHSHDIVVIDKPLYLSIERCFSKFIPNWEKYNWRKRTKKE